VRVPANSMVLLVTAARILGPAGFKIAAIRFNHSSCVSLVLILRCHSFASMSARPALALDQDLP
jgi:hypothetical protein